MSQDLKFNIWLPAIKSISHWALSPGESLGHVKFGHIAGPPAQGKGLHVPASLSQILSSESPSMSVTYVTSGLKVADILAAVMDAPGLSVLPYEEFLDLIQKSTAGQSSPVLILVDVDLDFSAPFALILVGLVSWANALGRDGKQAPVRLLTMSSEPLHPVVNDLLAHFGRLPITSFSLPDRNIASEHVEVVHVTGGRDHQAAVRAMSDRAELNAAESHTVISFRPESAYECLPLRHLWMEGQEKDLYKVSNQGGRCFISLPLETKISRHGPEPGYFHLILGESRIRKIFDRETSQIVEVSVAASASERRQQLSWVNRLGCPLSQLIIYQERGYLDGPNSSRRRRWDIANDQIEGYLAGLAGFQNWPVNSHFALSLLENIDCEAMLEVQRRLAQRDLLRFNGSARQPTLALPEPERRFFFQVLPLFNYDTRLAQFLVDESSSGRVLLAKVQIAALLAIDPFAIVTIEREANIDSVSEAATFGFTGNIARLGSLWLYLGLIKRALVTYDLALPHRPDGNAPDDLELLEGVVCVDTFLARKFINLIRRLEGVILSNGGTIPSATLDEKDLLEDHELDPIMKSLAKAFMHHMVMVDIHPGQEAIWSDCVSQRQIFWATDVDRYIQLNEVSATYPAGIPPMGFSPGLMRHSKKGRTAMSGWTWIPLRNLVHSWKDFESCQAIATRYGLCTNTDEL